MFHVSSDPVVIFRPNWGIEPTTLDATAEPDSRAYPVRTPGPSGLPSAVCVAWATSRTEVLGMP